MGPTSQHQELFRMATTTTPTWGFSLLTLGFLLTIANLSVAETVYCDADTHFYQTTKLGYKDDKVTWNSHRVGNYYKNDNGRLVCELVLNDVPSDKHVIISFKRFGVASESDIDCNEDYVQFEEKFSNSNFLSKKFCGRMAAGTDIIYKVPPIGPSSSETGKMKATFMRMGGEAGRGFKIRMFWVEDSDLDLDSIPVLPTS